MSRNRLEVRILMLLTFVFALFANGSMTASAQATADLVLAPSASSVAKGATFTVDVNVVLNGATIDTVDARLTFDPAVLEVLAVTKAATNPLNLDLVAPTFNNTTGTVRYLAGTPTPPAANFIFMTVQFKVKEATAETATEIEFAALADIQRQGFSRLGAANPATIQITSPPNNPPVANAGNSKTVTDVNNDTVEEVTLDGNLSADSDGSIVSYVWSEGGSPLGTGQMLVHPFAVGSHTVILTVTDNGGATDTDEVVITVLAGGTVNMVIAPASTNSTVASTFTVDVQVQAGAQTVNGAEVHLTFNPTKMALQSTVPGTALPTAIVAPTFNNTLGTFSYSAGKLGAPFPSGTFSLISLTFLALDDSAGTPLTLLDSFPTKSDVTSSAGTSVLNQLVDGSVVIYDYASLVGTVGLQGRPDKPNAAWILPLSVEFYRDGQATPVYTFAPSTNNNGQFALNELAPGTYSIAVQGATTVKVVDEVILVTGQNSHNFGLLLAGDADGNNRVDLVDFSILALTFNKATGQPGYDSRADFNGNTTVSLVDFSLLSANFNTLGETVPAASVASAASAPTASAGTAHMHLLPNSSAVQVGELLTVDVVMDAGKQIVSGVEVHLDFDPTLLRVARVGAGNGYDTALIAPTFDNQSGSVDYAAGRLDGQGLSGEVSLLSVVFEAVADGKATVSLANTFPRQSQAAYAGASLLGTSNPVHITIGTEVTGDEPGAPKQQRRIFLPNILGN